MIISILTLLLINQLTWATITSHRQRNRIIELENNLELTTSDFTETQAALTGALEELNAFDTALAATQADKQALQVTLNEQKLYASALKAMLNGLFTRHPKIYTTDVHLAYNGFIRNHLPPGFFQEQHQHLLYDQAMPTQPVPVDYPDTRFEDN